MVPPLVWSYATLGGKSGYRLQVQETPPYSRMASVACVGMPVNDFSNKATPVDFSLEHIEETMRALLQPYTLPRPRLIVSPEVMHLIETDPVVAEAARIALGEAL